MKKSMKKILAAGAAISALLTSLTMTASADIVDSLSTAKDQATNGMSKLATNVIIPLLIGICVIALIFAIVKFVKKKRQGEDYAGEIGAIVAIVLVIIVLSSFSVWGSGLFSSKAFIDLHTPYGILK